jgi:hypothetical protein
MLFREAVTVFFCENHTEHVNTLCGQNVIPRLRLCPLIPSLTFYIAQISMKSFSYSLRLHCNSPCCSLRVGRVKSIVPYVQAYVSGFCNLGIILFNRQNLMTARTFYLPDKYQMHLTFQSLHEYFIQQNKKFWEKLTVYFPLIRDRSNNSSLPQERVYQAIA